MHIVKNVLANNVFADIFNVKSWGGEKTRIQPTREVALEWRLVSALLPGFVAVSLLLLL